MVWDNYQGGSGKPITRSLLIELPKDTKLEDIENKVLETLTNKGIRGTYNNDKQFPYDRLLGVELLPVVNAT